MHPSASASALSSRRRCAISVHELLCSDTSAPATPNEPNSGVDASPKRDSLSSSDVTAPSPQSIAATTPTAAPAPSLAVSPPIRKPDSPQKTTTRGPWRIEEDRLLIELVRRYGARHWSAIATHFPRRSGKQARERWMNQLNPNLKKKNWTAQEDTLILQAHASMGNKWSAIAQLLPGRTDNSVKNRFNSTLRRAMRERAQSNQTMDIKHIVDSLHVRPYVYPQLQPTDNRMSIEPHPRRSSNNNTTTVSTATYDSSTSDERDLWARDSHNFPMPSPPLAAAGQGTSDAWDSSRSLASLAVSDRNANLRKPMLNSFRTASSIRSAHLSNIPAIGRPYDLIPPNMSTGTAPAEARCVSPLTARLGATTLGSDGRLATASSYSTGFSQEPTSEPTGGVLPSISSLSVQPGLLKQHCSRAMQ